MSNLIERLRATSVLVDGAPGLLEYLPGKKRIGPPDNITAIIQRLEAKCREAADALEAAERERKAMKAALKTLRSWDMLNPAPGGSEFTADAPWARKVIDDALPRDEPPAEEGL